MADRIHELQQHLNQQTYHNQNSLARAVVKASKFSHISPALKSLRQLKIKQRIDYNILSLTYRRCRGDMIETYKLLTHRYDNRNDLPLLQLDLNDRTRGNDMKLVKNHVRYDMRKYFFTCRIINLWNSLPAHVVHASSVNDFKNKLHAY